MSSGWRRRARLEPCGSAARSEAYRRKRDFIRLRVQEGLAPRIPTRDEAQAFLGTLPARPRHRSSGAARPRRDSASGLLGSSSPRPNAVPVDPSLDPALVMSAAAQTESAMVPGIDQSTTTMAPGTTAILEPACTSSASPIRLTTVQDCPVESQPSSHGTRVSLPSLVYRNEPHLPLSCHGKMIVLRFSGPNGQAIPYPGLVNLYCDHASLPQNLALAIGYARDDRPTRRQIFPVLDPGLCLSSTPGQLKPDWLVRDLGLHWTPEADAPDLKVNIYLTPVPDGIYVGSPQVHINLEEQRAARNAPCVVISRALLLKMLHAGYELPDSVLG